MAAHGDWTELYKYSDAVRSGDLVFCSGQTGLDEHGAAPADPAEQYRLAFASLRRVLAEQGCRPEDVVDLTSFHTHYPEHMAEFMAAKAEFQGDGRPAWTAIGVAALGTPETLVEVKATARVPAH
ncbi:RidA family protein [Tomitella gaofuii]|uniref:RidA family protein n=1 Tax=Tomitella gaofuii TaxID=2760083 RepID=UPI0015FE332A|nr:RidA family protein [Tomitella gaofuii]